MLNDQEQEVTEQAPSEELNEAPAGVSDLGGDDPNTGKASKLEPGTKKAPSRKADKSAGDGSQPTQGSSVKPAHEESEQDGEEISEEETTETISKSLTKNGMVAQIYDMMKTMSKDELSEKFGLIQDVVELDLQELNKETSDEEVVAEAQEKILYSRKDLTADEIELDTESDIQAIAGEELSEDFKEKAKGIFEAAVKSKVVEEVNKRVTQIEEEYLEEIEQSTKNFQAEMVEKVDNYLNYVVEEWMKENELAIEKGIRNELTEDFMNGLRNLFKEHYIDVPEEKIDIVDDLFEKVEELEDKLNEQIEKNVELKTNLKESTKESLINDVCVDLADTQKQKISDLSEGVEFENEEQFKAKLTMLKESYFPQTDVVQSEDVVEETTLTPEELNEEIENVQAESREASMQAYLDMLGRTNK